LVVRLIGILLVRAHRIVMSSSRYIKEEMPMRVPYSIPAPCRRLVSAPTPAREAPPLVVQYCIDDAGSYGDQYFVKANQLLAQAVTKRSTPGQQGAKIYLTLITDNTVASDSAFGQSIVMDPVDNPVLTPIPTPDTSNPYNNVSAHATATARAVARQIQAANTAANQGEQAPLAQATQEVQDGAQLLTNLQRQPSGMTDIYGCLVVASAHFSYAQPDTTKVLIIASDLQDNMISTAAPRPLAGVTVKVLFFHAKKRSNARPPRPNGKRCGCSAICAIPSSR
jgi:hypothetical protein